MVRECLVHDYQFDLSVGLMLQLSPTWSSHKAGCGAAQKKLKVRLALAALSAGVIYTSPVGNLS